MTLRELSVSEMKANRPSISVNAPVHGSPRYPSKDAIAGLHVPLFLQYRSVRSTFDRDAQVTI